MNNKDEGTWAVFHLKNCRNFTMTNFSVVDLASKQNLGHIERSFMHVQDSNDVSVTNANFTDLDTIVSAKNTNRLKLDRLTAYNCRTVASLRECSDYNFSNLDILISKLPMLPEYKKS